MSALEKLHDAATLSHPIEYAQMSELMANPPMQANIDKTKLRDDIDAAQMQRLMDTVGTLYDHARRQTVKEM